MAQFEVSSDTRFLSHAFEQAKPGEVVTFEALSAAIGRDVRKFAVSALHSALRIQVNEGRVFEAIKNQGYQRLTDADIIRTQAAKGLSKIGRIAKRTTRKVLNVDYEALSKADQTQHNTQISMLGAVGHLSKPKALNLLQGKVADKGAQLAIGETLGLMTK